MNITIFILSISIILLLLKRSRDRVPRIGIMPTNVFEKSMNFLPWISRSPQPIEGEKTTPKPGMTAGEGLLTVLASLCAIVMCVLELIDRLMPLLKG